MAERGIHVVREHLAKLPPSNTLTIAERRAQYERAEKVFPVPPDVKVERVSAPTAPAEWLLPPSATPGRVVLYLHGGGYIGTSPTMYAFFTARVCRAADCAVFVADYRLAPEFPYPAGAEDASAAYRALRALGIPNARIFLAGDSGGGGLANTILLSCPEHIEPLHPAGLLVFSPEVDLRLDEPSVSENADRDILPWNIPTASYLHGVDANDDSVSPLTADLRGFPPTCVTWGGNEMFRDPIRRYVARLRADGVPTEAQEFEGMFHVFQILMPWADDSRDVFRLVRDFIHDVVADAPPLTLGYLNTKLGGR